MTRVSWNVGRQGEALHIIIADPTAVGWKFWEMQWISNMREIRWLALEATPQLLAKAEHLARRISVDAEPPPVAA